MKCWKPKSWRVYLISTPSRTHQRHSMFLNHGKVCWSYLVFILCRQKCYLAADWMRSCLSVVLELHWLKFPSQVFSEFVGIMLHLSRHTSRISTIAHYSVPQHRHSLPELTPSSDETKILHFVLFLVSLQPAEGPVQYITSEQITWAENSWQFFNIIFPGIPLPSMSLEGIKFDYAPFSSWPLAPINSFVCPNYVKSF